MCGKKAFSRKKKLTGSSSNVTSVLRFLSTSALPTFKMSKLKMSKLRIADFQNVETQIVNIKTKTSLIALPYPTLTLILTKVGFPPYPAGGGT
jgi:uncharacterized membrane protein